MTAVIIALPVVRVDRSVKDDGSGNGARPIIAGFYRGNYEQADRFGSPYMGLDADSEGKHEPASDIDTAAADSLKVLDPKRPIREANIVANKIGALVYFLNNFRFVPTS